MNAVEAVRSNNRSTVSTIPLVVDLDGTLVKTDLLVESVLALVKQKPWYLLLLPLWLLGGTRYIGSVGLDIHTLLTAGFVTLLGYQLIIFAVFTIAQRLLLNLII